MNPVRTAILISHAPKASNLVIREGVLTDEQKNHYNSSFVFSRYEHLR